MDCQVIDCGMVQVQTNLSNGQDNDDEVEDDNNAKEDQTESRAKNENEKRVFELLKDVECNVTANPGVGWTKFLQRIRTNKQEVKIYQAC